MKNENNKSEDIFTTSNRDDDEEKRDTQMSILEQVEDTFEPDDF